VELELPDVFQFFPNQRKFEFEEHPQEAVSFELKVTGHLASRKEVTAEAKFIVTFFLKKEINIDQDTNVTSN